MKRLLLITMLTSLFNIIPANAKQEILKVNVTLVETCEPSICTKVSDTQLLEIEEYWKRYDININFNKTFINVRDNYKAIVDNTNSTSMEASMNRIRLLNLRGVEGDIVWFNTVLGLEDPDSLVVGWGSHVNNLLLTEHTVKEFVYVVNHELGHVFTLPHVNDITNLMYPTTEAIKGLLTDEQVKQARNNIKEEFN